MSNKSAVKIGNKIKLSLNNEIKELEIVDSVAGHSELNKISCSSPVGQMVLGRSCPDKFKVHLPNGNLIECQLIEILNE